MSRGSNLSSLTLLDPFNKHFLKQNTLRGITKIKAFLLTLSMHKRAGFGQRRYQRQLGTSDLGNPVTLIAKNWSVGEAGSQSLGPGKPTFCLEARH